MASSVNTTTSGQGVRWRNLRTGLLFLFGLGLVASLALIIGKNTGLLSRHSTAFIFVPDIKGLTEGNLVSISGKKVGSVKTMKFTTVSDTNGVLITLDIRTEFFTLITKDSKASIKSLGVLGDKFIDINLGRSPDLLEDGGYLVAGIDPGVEELTASALRTMTAIASMTEKINKGEGTLGKLITTNELNDKLVHTVANLETMSQNLNSNKGLAGRLINDQKLAGHMETLVTNLSDVSTSLKGGKGSLGKLLVDETFYNNLNLFAQRSDTLMARLNNPNGSLGKLSQDPQVYTNLNQSLMAFDSLMIDLKKNPGRYVKFSLF